MRSMFNVLMERINSLEQQNSEMQMQTERINSLEQQNSEMQMRNSEMQMQINSLQTENQRTQRENQRIQRENQRIQRENRKFRDRVQLRMSHLENHFELLTLVVTSETNDLKSKLLQLKPKNRSFGHGDYCPCSDCSQQTVQKTGFNNWSLSKSRRTNRSLQETRSQYDHAFLLNAPLFSA